MGQVTVTVVSSLMFMLLRSQLGVTETTQTEVTSEEATTAASTGRTTTRTTIFTVSRTPNTDFTEVSSPQQTTEAPNDIGTMVAAGIFSFAGAALVAGVLYCACIRRRCAMQTPDPFHDPDPDPTH